MSSKCDCSQNTPKSNYHYQYTSRTDLIVFCLFITDKKDVPCAEGGEKCENEGETCTDKKCSCPPNQTVDKKAKKCVGKLSSSRMRVRVTLVAHDVHRIRSLFYHYKQNTVMKSTVAESIIRPTEERALQLWHSLTLNGSMLSMRSFDFLA